MPPPPSTPDPVAASAPALRALHEPHRWRALALGLALSLAGAALCLALHTPLPWMIGPLVFTAAAKMARAPLRASYVGRNAGQWVIGTALGLYFTPEVTRQIVRHGGGIVLGALFAFVLCLIGTALLKRFARVDFRTAFFASAIGGASEMAVLAERYEATVDRVAAAHSLRILLVVLTIPALYAMAGVHGLDPYVPGPKGVQPLGLIVLIAVTAGAAFVLQSRRLPNPWVIGPMMIAILLTSNGIVFSALPQWMVNGGQLLIGWSLGDRFTPGFFRAAPRFLGCVAVFTYLAMGLAALFGWGLAAASDIHPATLILGTTPGGIAEMCITAKVLQLGVPVVTAFHVVRMAFVVLVTGPLYRLLQPYFEKPA